MKGGFQKSVQLFVANGYCVFEDDICVDLPDILNGKPNFANSPVPEFFARDQSPPPPPPPPRIIVLFEVAAVKVYG